MAEGERARSRVWEMIPSDPDNELWVNRSIVYLDQDKGGHLAKWVEKVSFDRICWLLNIKPTQRTSQVLLTALNLLDIQRHPK
ncbi:hypothetical protein CK203_095245 [Vitis vinifera]|uniref:Uncharacterized protein n=1 Tax=Vitis vinifera TaxID=29760 RepID=A0A438BRC5_VITVI|nr:hypothetical protein CK203_095245 [Vitis vinifera]